MQKDKNRKKSLRGLSRLTTLQTVLEFMKVDCEMYNRSRCLSDLRSSKVEAYMIRFAEESKLWYN